MRPAALGSPGRASLEDEGPVTVKLEDSEEDEPAAWDLGPEAARQQFRRFRYEEAAGPGQALAQLRELCRQWLRPEAHSKEQMLELLVLEQFLGVLPPEIQARVRGQQPGSPEEAAALVEGFRREPGGPRRWVTVQVQGQEVLSERTEPPDFQALPQPIPETPEPGLEMLPGATEQSTLGLLSQPSSMAPSFQALVPQTGQQVSRVDRQEGPSHLHTGGDWAGQCSVPPNRPGSQARRLVRSTSVTCLQWPTIVQAPSHLHHHSLGPSTSGFTPMFWGTFL